MSRAVRIEFNGAHYHVMARGVARGETFLDDEDRRRYRDYVEAGKGEKAISRFERAVAGLVLGSERFVRRMRALVKDRPDAGDQPALRGLRRGEKAEAEAVEAAVRSIFAGAGPARRRRLCLYALREHSALRPAEIARRCGRSHGAVYLAVRDLQAEARRNAALSDGLARLAEVVQN